VRVEGESGRPTIGCSRVVAPALARSWAITLVIVGVVTLVRLLIIGVVGPYPLIEDEAHYWEWSRRLDWSYYSKGPGVAWVIALTTGILGNTELGVRVAAPIFCAIGAIGVAGLDGDATPSRRARPYGAVCFLAAPFFLGTRAPSRSNIRKKNSTKRPGTPAARSPAWAGWRALDRSSPRAWLLLGLAIGVGFLFKYTALLLVPGLVLFALVRRQAARPAWAVVLGSLVTLACMVPVALWNARAGWPTLKHLLGHLGVAGGDQPQATGTGYSPIWTIEYLGVQLAVAGPSVIVAGAVIWRVLASASRRERSPGIVYLACCAAPVLLFYLMVSFATRVEANWAVAAYPTLFAASGYGIARGLFRARLGSRGRQIIRVRFIWRMTMVIGVIGIGVLAMPGTVLRLPLIGPMIPAGRFSTGPDLAARVDALRDRLTGETGASPAIVTSHYGLAGLLAFYLPDRPTVHSASAQLGGRKTQYDYFSDTDLADLEAGRPTILVGADGADWGRIFRRVETVEGGAIPLHVGLAGEQAIEPARP